MDPKDHELVLDRSENTNPGLSFKDPSARSLLPFTSLSVPPNRQLRRPSVESTFSGSDISELSFGSTELGSAHHDGLIRTLSNASATLASIPSPSAWRSGLREFWVANYGAFLVLISQMFGCMMNIATRLLETPGPHGAPMHPFQILFVRQLITASITSTYALWSGSVPHFPFGPPGQVRLLLVARGLFGFFGVFGMYFSLLYLPINEATILTFLAPIGAGYTFSLLIPGETFSRQQQLAGFISLLGVVFIARPASLFSSGEVSPDPLGIEVGSSSNATHSAQGMTTSPPTSAQHLQAVGVGMVGVLGAIGAITSIRAIGTRAHALISVNYFSVWCTIVSLFALIVFPSVHFRLPGNLTEWGLLSILGCCGFIMQLLLTQGMAYGGPSNSNKTRGQETVTDLEMQDRESIATRHDSIVFTTPSLNTLAAPVASRPSPQTKQIKGSGVKATSMLYTQILFALIADKIIFGVTPGVWSWIGSGFILFGAVWVAADGGKKKTTSANLNVSPTGQRVVSPKDMGVAHEEEVGLLADMEDAHTSLQDLGSDTPTSSRSR